MKKIILLSIFCFVLVGCDDGSPGYGTIVPEENREKAAAFIEKACTAANPKSDEEGEDLVYQVEKTALTIYGKKVLGMWSSGYRRFTPYDDLSEYDKKRCDAYAKDG